MKQAAREVGGRMYRASSGTRSADAGAEEMYMCMYVCMREKKQAGGGHAFYTLRVRGGCGGPEYDCP